MQGVGRNGTTDAIYTILRYIAITGFPDVEVQEEPSLEASEQLTD